MFFDRVEQDGNNSVVIIDNYKCGYQATKHLIEQGCNRIAACNFQPETKCLFTTI